MILKITLDSNNIETSMVKLAMLGNQALPPEKSIKTEAPGCRRGPSVSPPSPAPSSPGAGVVSRFSTSCMMTELTEGLIPRASSSLQRCGMGVTLLCSGWHLDNRHRYLKDIG